MTTTRAGWGVVVVTCLLAVAAGTLPVHAAAASGRVAKGGSGTSPSSSSVTGGSETWQVARTSAPAGSVVHDANGRLLARFTDGSRSAVVTGPARTFAEPSTTSATVRTTSWVRLLPAAFTGDVDAAWLTASLRDRSPDVLAAALSYTTGAPEVRDASGAHLSGDASYGPLVDGKRLEGSDWNDYYGVAATYDGVVDRPEADQRRAVDCSGYLRLVFGQRGGLPMALQPDGVRLPRRAVQMATMAPGTVVVPDTGTQVRAFDRLLAGDLVLFDASADDGTDVDHIGIYLGTDSQGKPRFVSSRKTADGPTMGDLGGRSRLDGTGLYATSFRSVRRL